MRKWIHFKARRCQKSALYQKKKLRIKVVKDSVSYKRNSGPICLPSPAVELGGSEDWFVSNIILYRNGKVNSLSGSTLPKIHIIWENASNKSCRALNSVQKSQRARTFIIPKRGARGLQRLTPLKYCNVSKLTIFGAPSSTYGKIDACSHWLFCTEFNARQLLFEAFSQIMRIFDSIEPESESTFPFQYNIIFETNQSLENLAPRLREIDMCAHSLFCTQFNAQ